MGLNPKFDRVLARMAQIHDSKSQDYARPDNRYSNFEFAGQLGAMFSRKGDIAFAVLIGVKLARLSELQHRPPQNESVADTRMDLAVYAALWASYDEATTRVPPPVPPLADELTGGGDPVRPMKLNMGKRNPVYPDSPAVDQFQGDR